MSIDIPIQGAIELIAPEGWIRTSDQTDRVGDIAVYLEGCVC